MKTPAARPSAVFFLFILSIAATPLARPAVSGEIATLIGIKRFTIASPAMDYYQSLDVLLYQRLNFEILPHGVTPFLIQDTVPQECIAIATGSIDIVDSLPILTFTITGLDENTPEEESKKISLNNQPVDAVVDVMTLKMRNFLEGNISGKVNITSKPKDCSIFLNGIRIGATPAELTLKQGKYALRLQRDYFLPFKDSIMISPGRETIVKADLQFEGHRLQPWIISGTVLAIATLAFQIAETYYQSAYLSLTPEEGDLFDPYFNRYKTANILKITFLIPTITAGTISISNFLENRSLKKRLFNE
ncbi:MAG: PEGA domain-containing protein [Chitinispirillaceae bacterium]|nr:PEGA domain-containing protein [Chitinispirillaceae bacterium]